MIMISYKDALGKNHSIYLKQDDVKTILSDEIGTGIFNNEIRLNDGKQIIFQGYDIIVGGIDE